MDFVTLEIWLSLNIRTTLLQEINAPWNLRELLKFALI